LTHAPGQRSRSRLQLAPDLAPLLPGLGALLIFVVWASHGGGYASTVWMPGAVLVVMLTGIAAVAYPGAVRSMPPLVIAAIGSFAAFTIWCFVSIAWSDDKGIAWEGANRTALYLAVFVLFALTPWSVRGAACLLTLFSLAIAVVAGVELIQAVSASHPGRFFDGGRFSEPVGYSNGTAALFLVAFWPGIALATRRELPPVLRALLFAGCGILAETAVLSQSRGSLFTMPIVAVLFVALVPRRVLAILGLLAVGVTVLVVRDPLLDVYRVVLDHGDIHQALRRAGAAIAISGASLFAIGLAGAFLDRRLAGWGGEARLRLAGSIAVTILLAAGAVLLAVKVEDPWTRVDHAWHSFTEKPAPLGNRPDPNSHFVADAGSGNRYDFWRVAWDEFNRHPVRGVGVDNFAADYLLHRRTVEEPLYPFSVELRVFSQTGVIGALAFVLFVATAVGAAWQRRGNPWQRAIAVGCLAPLAYWLIHGSAEWLWEIPAVTAPVVALLALSARLGGDQTAAKRPLARGRSAALAVVAVLAAGGAIAIAASLAFPWGSALKVQSATQVWRQQPQLAFARLDSARTLNPLSDQPDLIAGAIATNQRDWGRARFFLLRALGRNGRNWYPYLELGLIDAYTGHRARAFRELRKVRALNPRERLTDFVEGRLRIREPVPPPVINAILRKRVEAVIAPAPTATP
jgi:hypothetical protein